MFKNNIPVKYFAGSGSVALANRMANRTEIILGNSTLTRFSDGEFETYFEETVRGAYVYLIQSTHQPTDNLLELLFMIDAARRSSAYKVIAVIPYFGFARQDRKDRSRSPIGAKLIANMFTAAGLDRLITMDLHADQLQGFFDIPVDHLYASSVFVPYLEKLNLSNLIFAAPDMGGSKRANNYAKYFGTELVVCNKSRTEANKIESMSVIGNIKGKDIIIVDDMIDTAGTITKAADLMIENGAQSVRAMASHAVLSGSAIERIEKSHLQEVIFTDSIPLQKKSSKIKIISIAEFFVDIINRINNYESIHSKFLF